VGEFQVSPTDLRSHAAHLGQISQGVSVAADAAGQASISDGSLGKMIGPLVVGPLMSAEAIAGSTIESAGDTLKRLAEQLKEMAQDFEVSESDIEQSFRNMDIPIASGISNTSSGQNNPRISSNLIRRLGG